MPPKREHAQLELEILPQPDTTTCGPTCLHAVDRYWGDEVPLERVVAEVDPLPGGTWTDPLGDPHDGILHPFTQPPGAYTYTVAIPDDCPGTAVVQMAYLPADDPVCVLLGMTEQAYRWPLLHPNPTPGELWWEVGSGTGLERMELYDATGRRVYELTLAGQAHSGRLSLPDHLPNGSLVLRMLGRDGRSTLHRLLLLR